MIETGDLVVKCHKCGSIYTIEKDITDGRAIYLFNKPNSHVKLNCSNCDITLEMCIQPSENIIENEELSKEVTKEENI